MEKTESNNPVVTPPAEDESKKESSAEKMPPPPSRQEQANIEKAEEVKLRAKYPQVIRYYRRKNRNTWSFFRDHIAKKS